MKKLLLFLLLVVGALAAAVRPGFYTDGTHVQAEASNNTEVDAASGLDVTYTLDLADPLGKTLILGDAALFGALEGDTKWVISLTAEKGELRAEDTVRPQLKPHRGNDVTLSISIDPEPTKLYMPDGNLHYQHHVHLRAALNHTPLWRWQKPSRALLLQEWVVDTHDGAVDMVMPVIPAAWDAAPVTQLPGSGETGLPSRFCGSESEQALQRFVFLMAAMHNAEAVQQRLPQVRKRAQALIEAYTDPEKDWPDCWGPSRSAALDAHRAILPYLLRLQGMDCFGNAELADFINSPEFGRLFGSDWSGENP